MALPVDNVGSSASPLDLKVALRFRPLSPEEIEQGDKIVWKFVGEKIVRSDTNVYAYDMVFGPTDSTSDVYDIGARHVVHGALDGITGLIVAYGAPRTGNTLTINTLGIFQQSMDDVFYRIQETPKADTSIFLSCLEIHDEDVNDLLDSTRRLDVCDDTEGIFRPHATERRVFATAEVLTLISNAEEYVHASGRRSHIVVIVTIKSRQLSESKATKSRLTFRRKHLSESKVTESRLYLVVLASPESSEPEITALNRSLESLGQVISDLQKGVSHISYGNSILIRLLRSSLTVNGRIFFICTASSSIMHLEETNRTLMFASALKPVDVLEALFEIVQKKEDEITSLKGDLEDYKRITVTEIGATVNDLHSMRVHTHDLSIKYAELEGEHCELQSQKRELESRLAEMESKFVDMEKKFEDMKSQKEALECRLGEFTGTSVP